MTEVRDIFTVKLPFPNISSNLATRSHMYLCVQSGHDKKILSCQTKKPLNLQPNKPPYNYVDCDANIAKNPFKRNTLIACDYCFVLRGIHVDSLLLTTSRRNVCEGIYSQVLAEIWKPGFTSKYVDEAQLLRLNPLLSRL